MLLLYAYTCVSLLTLASIELTISEMYRGVPETSKLLTFVEKLSILVAGVLVVPLDLVILRIV